MPTPKRALLSVYNLATIGVDVDTDNLHAPVGGFRQTQNMQRNPTELTAESIIGRPGLRDLNVLSLGTGPVLGGVVIPVFESGSGVPSFFLGFGD